MVSNTFGNLQLAPYSWLCSSWVSMPLYRQTMFPNSVTERNPREQATSRHTRYPIFYALFSKHFLPWNLEQWLWTKNKDFYVLEDMVTYSGIIRCVGAHFLLLSGYTSSSHLSVQTESTSLGASTAWQTWPFIPSCKSQVRILCMSQGCCEVKSTEEFGYFTLCSRDTHVRMVELQSVL